MSNRIDLSQISGTGGIASIIGLPVLAIVWFALSPGYVDRGLVSNLTLPFLGNSFTAYVNCTDEPAPTLVESFFGMGAGERKWVRAWSYRDATDTLATAFPDCDIASPKRTRRSSGLPGHLFR